MLELDDARKYYAGPGGVVRAVDGVTLSVDEGELVAIFGPSGSGKTTLLLLAAGLLGADEGMVRFCGTDLAALGKQDALAYRRKELGFIFQNFNLVPGFTAEENVALPLLLGAVPHRTATSAALSMLDVVGLRARAQHLPAQLSGGEQQRVSIARALVGEPRLVLADEPTGNLDTEKGDTVLALLSDFARERKVAVVLVTHDARAAAYADHIRAMRDGKLVAHEPDDGGVRAGPPSW